MPCIPSRIEDRRRAFRLAMLAILIGSGFPASFIDASRFQVLLHGESTSPDELDDAGKYEPTGSDDSLDAPPMEVSGRNKRLKLSGRELREKQRQVQAVVLLFMGVVILGVAMFAALLLYGSWMRRMNRRKPSANQRLEVVWEKLKRQSELESDGTSAGSFLTRPEGSRSRSGKEEAEE